MMSWFDSHFGLLALIIIVVLVLIIIYYSMEMRNQARYARKTLDMEVRMIKNTGMNYSYLLSTEFNYNQNILASYINDKVKFEDTAVVFYNFNNFQNLKLEIWDEIKTEVPKYFSATLMYDLVEYYSKVEDLAVNSHFNNDQRSEMVVEIFKSMYTCINLMESEFKIEIKKRETLHLDECTIKVNTKTGEIAVSEKS
ncbi:MAG: hypothetical protein ACM3X7_12090 [Solirubrobacterales bacterium]